MVLTYMPALPEDAEQVFRLCRQLIDDYENLAAIDYEKVLGWVGRKIRGNIASYTRVMAEGQIVGWYCLDKSTGELDDLYILEDFRGKGVGTKIIQKCIDECPMPIWLYVFTKNTRAVALYERMGFTIREKVGATRCIMKR